MEEQPDTTPDEKRSVGFMGPLGCAMAIVLFYFLSAGPVAMMQYRGVITPRNKFVEVFYAPWGWVMDNTPLKTPMESYIEMWIKDPVKTRP